MPIEKIDGPPAVHRIGMGYADGVDALLRRKAPHLQAPGLDGTAQLREAGGVEILQVQMGAGGPELNGFIAQTLCGGEEIIQGIPLVVVVRTAQLRQFHNKQPLFFDLEKAESPLVWFLQDNTY